MLFSSPSEAESSLDWPPAGLLTYASTKFDSPSQDASQWLITNRQTSQRLQLRGSDGFTPSSQHQIKTRLPCPPTEVKFDKSADCASSGPLPAELQRAHPALDPALPRRDIHCPAATIQSSLHICLSSSAIALQMSHAILRKASRPAPHNRHLRLRQRTKNSRQLQPGHSGRLIVAATHQPFGGGAAKKRPHQTPTLRHAVIKLLVNKSTRQ